MCGLLLCLGVGRVYAQDSDATALAGQQATVQDAVFATVGDDVITAASFQVNLEAAYRQRFFHGKVPREQALAFRRQVAANLVEHLLLYREAQHRGIKADEGWIGKQAQGIEARYRKLPQWRKQGAEFMTQLHRQLVEQSLIDQLRGAVTSLAVPLQDAVRRYYQAHPQVFTTPERLHLSMILFKVAPWAPATVWEEAAGKARQLLKELAAGADFARLARAHSGDASAAKGGDLGYVHQGMLSTEAQRVVAGMKPGTVSAPVRLLQGYALFRLEERLPARLNSFEHVAARARRLLLREQKAQAWQTLIGALRKKTPISINKSLLEAIR